MRMLGCLAGRDNRVRMALGFLLAALVGVAAGPAMAQCSSANTRYYFTGNPPVSTPNIMFVRVTVVSTTFRRDGGTTVEARLEGSFAALSADGMIRIEVPQIPEDGCVEWGRDSGPVYVVASTALVQNGHASMVAEPVRPRGAGMPELILQQQRRTADIRYPDLDALMPLGNP